MTPDGGSLQWASQHSVTAALLVAATALALAWLAWRASAGLSLPRRAGLLGLRGLALLGLLVVWLQPTWVTPTRLDDASPVVALVDRSASMQALPQRAQAAARALQALRDGGPIVERPFDAKLRGAAGAAPSGAGRPGDATDILASLDGLARDAAQGRVPAAVIVVSDGRDHGALGAGDDSAVSATLEALGAPVHAVAIADAQPIADVMIAALRVSAVGLVRQPLAVEVDVDFGGFSGKDVEVPVTLALDGVEVDRAMVRPEGQPRRQVRLQVRADVPGPHVLTAEAVTLPGEVTDANNRWHQPISMVRDRVRVMHLAGHPSWDTRALREALRADPQVDLVSFYIMIGRGGGTWVAADETTLIAFPSEQLFGPALPDFDLVIFQDFQFAAFDIDRYLPGELRPWVTRGGGFLVVGGRQSLAAANWQSTAIGPLLPVDLTGPEEGGYVDDAKPDLRLTDVGAAHPLTRLRDDEAANVAAWAAAGWTGQNRGQVARADDAVLVQSVDGVPLLAVGEREEGRVAMLATDGLWRWAFPAEDGRGREAARADYVRLLANMVGWLLRDPRLERLQLQGPDRALEPGEPLAVPTRLLGRDQRPAEGATIAFERRRLPSGAWEPAGQCDTDRQGRCEARLAPGGAGAWQLRAQAAGTRAVLAYGVADAPRELRDLRLDRASLERLARLAAGTIVADAAKLDPAALRGPPEVTVARDRSELWGHPATLLLILGLLIGEWALRRRWGLR